MNDYTATSGEAESGLDADDAGEKTGKKFKKRRIGKADWDKVEKFLKAELESRKASTFRRHHEMMWAEVDRQIAMKPLVKTTPLGAPITSWQSSFELGELSKASEVLSADIRRLVFPSARNWFAAHSDLGKEIGPEGQALPPDPKKQQAADSLLGSMMSQQHQDFGLKARVDLSVKEALHHGGFVATVEWEDQQMVHDGTGFESKAAPVWKPHSMWNCFPDPSPSVIGTNLFYTGSMMIVSYQPLSKVKAYKGEKYMNLDKIKRQNNMNKDESTEDVELVHYYGDLCIERTDGDIYLPNSCCVTANGTIIYYEPNELPFANVIYAGYEKLDVRDPYFYSPIIKNSPLQKMASILANRFVDGVDLHTNPPVEYDGNDPMMVQNGGPSIYPGAKTAKKSGRKTEQVVIGDPVISMKGAEWAIGLIQSGTGVNNNRAGQLTADRQTATEVRNTQAMGETRTVDFVDKLENQGLLTFLYMQHEWNIRKLDTYTFYCEDPKLPDFNRLTKDQLPKRLRFDVTGSKGVLGEERRSQQMTGVTAFAAGHPMFGPLLKPMDILIEMYQDAGVKQPERFLNVGKPQIPPELMAKMQQAQQMIQELQQEVQKLQSGMAAKELEWQAKTDIADRDRQVEAAKIQGEQAIAQGKVQSEYEVRMATIQASMKEASDAILAGMKQTQDKIDADMQKAVFQTAHTLVSDKMERMHQQNTPAEIHKDVHPETGRMTGATLIFSDGRQTKVKVH